MSKKVGFSLVGLVIVGVMLLATYSISVVGAQQQAPVKPFSVGEGEVKILGESEVKILGVLLETPNWRQSGPIPSKPIIHLGEVCVSIKAGLIYVLDDPRGLLKNVKELIVSYILTLDNALLGVGDLVEIYGLYSKSDNEISVDIEQRHYIRKADSEPTEQWCPPGCWHEGGNYCVDGHYTTTANLLPGDLLLARYNDNLLTPWGDSPPGDWDHIGIYVGGNRVVEAQGRIGTNWAWDCMGLCEVYVPITSIWGICGRNTPGVCNNGISSWRNKGNGNNPRECLRVDATSDQRQTAVNFALSQVGKVYNWHYENKHTSSSRPCWYCSELVWAAYMAAGIDLDSNSVNWSLGGVAPQEIHNSSHTYVIDCNWDSHWVCDEWGYQGPWCEPGCGVNWPPPDEWPEW